MSLAFQQSNATPRKMATLMGGLLCVEKASTSSTWQLCWGHEPWVCLGVRLGPRFLRAGCGCVVSSWPWLPGGWSLCGWIEEVCKVQSWLCFSMLETSSHQTYAGRLVSGSCAAWAAFGFLYSVLSWLPQSDPIISVNWGSSTYFRGGACGRAWYLGADGRVDEDLGRPCNLCN